MNALEQLALIREVIENEYGNELFTGTGEEKITIDWNSILDRLRGESMEQKCNGWTNYSTWRVHLEMVDGSDAECFGYCENIHELADAIKEQCEEIISTDSSGLALDYALAFLSDVNWYEIAEHIAEDNDMFAGDEEEE